jgi:hypothetical protein
MTVTATDPVALAQGMLADLHRLVEAIDLRTPRPERPEEARIARDAAELRARAVVLIHYIEGTTSPNRATPPNRAPMSPERQQP